MSTLDTVLSLFIAAFAGTLIGYLNQRRGGAGGVRTFGLICSGAALAAIVSRQFFVSLGLPWAADPGRLSAQVIPALFFLSAGVFWVDQAKAQGISTVIGLWVTAILGLMLGSGLGWKAIVIFSFIMGIYFLLDWLTDYIYRRNRTVEGDKENKMGSQPDKG
ncbi:MAG: MgtC/SapB family protein [Syntrophomonadaceae bacterium]|nr:MgtC/SapB family protein [Syntrophomonadaceae bacterium]